MTDYKKVYKRSSILLFKQFYCLMQPKKQAILNLLERVGSPLNTQQIADIIKLDHKTTGFHLIDLGEIGFVTSILKLKTKRTRRAIKWYSLAKSRDGSIKVKKARQKILKVLNQ